MISVAMVRTQTRMGLAYVYIRLFGHISTLVTRHGLTRKYHMSSKHRLAHFCHVQPTFVTKKSHQSTKHMSSKHRLVHVCLVQPTFATKKSHQATKTIGSLAHPITYQNIPTRQHHIPTSPDIKSRDLHQKNRKTQARDTNHRGGCATFFQKPPSHHRRHTAMLYLIATCIGICNG